VFGKINTVKEMNQLDGGGKRKRSASDLSTLSKTNISIVDSSSPLLKHYK